MSEKELTTLFAPAERGSDACVQAQLSSLVEDKLLVSMLDAISVAVLILNGFRQIIYSNKAFLNMLGISDMDLLVGQRVGEAVGCIYSARLEGGCGTTEYCRECGAARAFLSTVEEMRNTQECRISLGGDPRSLDLRVTSEPFDLNGEELNVFSIVDISNEKRKAVLERIFLHDVKNTAGGLQGLGNLISGFTGEELQSSVKLICVNTEKLFDEINSYHQIVLAENNTLKINRSSVNSDTLLKSVRDLFQNHDVARNRHIVIHHDSDEVWMESDELLLYRILGNMTKNALEATRPGETVTLTCTKHHDSVRYEVHNQGVIPEEVQLQIFQRSFTTKGTGRGVGTYSVKLLSEKFLGGKVGFSSSKGAGTTFFCVFPIEMKN